MNDVQQARAAAKRCLELLWATGVSSDQDHIETLNKVLVACDQCAAAERAAVDAAAVVMPMAKGNKGRVHVLRFGA